MQSMPIEGGSQLHHQNSACPIYQYVANHGVEGSEVVYISGWRIPHHSGVVGLEDADEDTEAVSPFWDKESGGTFRTDTYRKNFHKPP